MPKTRRDRRRTWLASAYRPQTLAQAALLSCAHYLPVGRSRNLLQQLTAIEVSTGFLAGIRAQRGGWSESSWTTCANCWHRRRCYMLTKPLAAPTAP